ncbi:hypothetical protein [Ereboglobus luteus]|uniref:hypothetical protein n=1 Tax=Ereboglobus luteus TaxID=1796921 RepID=UPI0012601C43|nr:hypothetical protein [Ereboglobus luteus]
MRKEMPPGSDEKTVTCRILAEFRAPQWKHFALPQRASLARMTQEQIRRPSPGIGTVAFAALCYTSPLWLGLSATMAVSHARTATMAGNVKNRAAAAGVADTLPPLVFAPVADEDNAALPYLRACEVSSRLWEQRTTSDMRQTSPNDTTASPEEAAVLDELREAARKPAFALPEKYCSRDGASDSLNAMPLMIAARQARRMLHYGQPAQAFSLACDGLRMLRHLQTAPGCWQWPAYLATNDLLWAIIEETLVQGVDASPAQLQELASCADEQLLLDYATEAILAQQYQMRRMYREFGNAPLDSGKMTFSSALQRAVLLISKISTAGRRIEANALNQTAALQASLDDIRKGRWPQPAPDVRANENTEQSWQDAPFQINDGVIKTLADCIASTRLRRIALGLFWDAHPENKSGGIKAPWRKASQISHPISGEKIRLQPRGAFQAFVVTRQSSAYSRFSDATASTEITWRVPTRIANNQ